MTDVLNYQENKTRRPLGICLEGHTEPSSPAPSRRIPSKTSTMTLPLPQLNTPTSSASSRRLRAEAVAPQGDSKRFVAQRGQRQVSAHTFKQRYGDSVKASQSFAASRVEAGACTKVLARSFCQATLGVSLLSVPLLYQTVSSEAIQFPFASTFALKQVDMKPLELYLNSPVPITPDMFLSNLPIEEDVSLSFLEEPPTTDTLGVTLVPVMLRDSSGNEQVIVSSLSIRRYPPDLLVEGIEDIQIFIGDAISYRSGVTALDKYGETVPLSIDASQVDVYTEGVYPVTYSVADNYGNQVVQEISVHVDDNTRIMVEQYIDDIFQRILTEDMTKHQKAYAIFRWCRSNLRYASSGPSDDYYSIAYGAFRGQPGDCHTYFAVSYLMLKQAEIPVIPLERIAGTGVNHYWLAVNTGSGYYHFDTCPTYTGDEIFMYSESQIRAVSAATDAKVGYARYYFDYKPLPNGITIQEK